MDRQLMPVARRHLRDLQNQRCCNQQHSSSCHLIPPRQGKADAKQPQADKHGRSGAIFVCCSGEVRTSKKKAGR
jgi:hypothetical protein